MVEILLCVVVAVVIWLFVWPNDYNTCEPPYPECFDCDKSTCEGCLIPKKEVVL